MGSIFCIGQSAYDITIPLTEPIVENQKYRIEHRIECGGGPAFHAAYLCGMWGAEVSLISRIGADGYGEILKQSAREKGICLDYLIEDGKMKTPHSFIFSNSSNGSRTLFNFPGRLQKVDYQYPDIQVDVILSDGHEPEISVGAIAAYPNAISVVDAGTCRESTLTVARKVDYLVCSEDFARQYTGKTLDLQHWELCEDIFHEVEKINGKITVITMGEQGLLYKEDGVVKRLPAYPAKAVDTNGAGDIFHGAFAYGLYRKMPPLEILKLSSMASAISVESLGGQTSIPELNTVEAKLKKGI